MKIGSLYTVKKFCWLLFPTKKTAASRPLHRRPAAGGPAHCPTDAAAAYWSRAYNCEVTYFSPESFIVFLEEDKKLNRVLTGDGRIGWIWFNEDYISCFEEISNE